MRSTRVSDFGRKGGVKPQVAVAIGVLQWLPLGPAAVCYHGGGAAFRAGGVGIMRTVAIGEQVRAVTKRDLRFSTTSQIFPRSEPRMMPWLSTQTMRAVVQKGPALAVGGGGTGTMTSVLKLYSGSGGAPSHSYIITMDEPAFLVLYVTRCILRTH